MSNTGESSNGPGLHRQCACCKFKHLKCGPDCPLAPYFPEHKMQDFVNANRLFGLRNIVRILNQAPQGKKRDAMQSVIYEGYVRAVVDPVGGCTRVIKELEATINARLVELQIVMRRLDRCFRADARRRLFNVVEGARLPVTATERMFTRADADQRSTRDDAVKFSP